MEFQSRFPNKEQPNFTSKKAEKAEYDFKKMIKENHFLGVEEASLSINKYELISVLKKDIPERIKLVLEKTGEQEHFLDQLTKEQILDKVLAIDFLFSFMGKKIAVDVASGGLRRL